MTKQELLKKADDNRGILENIIVTDEISTKMIDSSNTLDIKHSISINGIGQNRDDRYGSYKGQVLALEYMMEFSKNRESNISEEILKKLHALSFREIVPNQAGEYRTISGEMSAAGFVNSLPVSEDITRLMGHFINQMESSKVMFHPIEFAAMCNKRFLDISPFLYGNHFIAALLCNIILQQSGYGFMVIGLDLQEDYIRLYNSSHSNKIPDIDNYVVFIGKCLLCT